MAGMLTVTLRRSTIGEKPKTRLVVAGLGLGKLNSSRVLPDNPSVRGAVHRVRHLVEVTEDEATSEPAVKRSPQDCSEEDRRPEDCRQKGCRQEGRDQAGRRQEGACRREDCCQKASSENERTRFSHESGRL